jgi:pimeloyl-ACP methyl ester carboxylesterase
LFGPFAAALGSRLNVITVRYPATEALRYEELEEIARQAPPSHGDYNILGESFSGPIAVALAASNPRGLVGLILCGTFIRNPRLELTPLQLVSNLLPIGWFHPRLEPISPASIRIR